MSTEDDLIDPTIIEKLIYYTDMRGDDECWHWLGYFNMSNTRGILSYQGRNELAYRLVYMMINGPIPKGKIIMHTCDNPRCVNPNHLKLGTHKDNSQDMIAKGRQPAKWGTASWRRI